MPLVNLGAQRTRSRVVKNVGPVDSIGIGTNAAAEALTDVQLGGGAGGESDFKPTGTGATLTDSEAADTAATVDPWWQLEATWGTAEFNGRAVTEIGTSAGSLDGLNPVAQDGTLLYTRKRVGGAGGLGKTADYSLIARVKLTYPSS